MNYLELDLKILTCAHVSLSSSYKKEHKKNNKLTVGTFR